jgi:hypothetical protein
MMTNESVGRTKITKGALLFFTGQVGVRSCTVRDITSVGAGVRIQDLPVLPISFALSFDNFRTSRKCADLAGWRLHRCGIRRGVSYSLLTSAANASTTNRTVAANRVI